MKNISKCLSLFLALIMLFGVLTIAPISASAAVDGKQAAAVDREEENISYFTGNEDSDEGEGEELPEGDMAKPESISVENIEIYEDVDAQLVNSYDDDNNEHKWSSYVFNDKIKCTITLEDDNVLTTDEDGCVVYNGKEFEIEFDDGQSWETPWGTGDHNVTFSILGLETTAVVTVLPSPIDRVEFKDVTCVEGTNGWISSYYSWDDENSQNKLERVYFCYDTTPEFTVYLKSGETIKSDEGGVDILGVSRDAETDTRQYLAPWGVGSRKVTATLFNKEYEFNYTINESDIKSISVENITVYDGADTSIEYYYVDGVEHSYKRFNFNPTISITLKNGSTVTKKLEDEKISVGSTEYKIDTSDDQDDENEWETGVQSAYIFVGAQSQKINVTVVESPVKTLTIEDVEIRRGIDSSEEYDWDYEKYWDEYHYTPDFKVELKNGQTVNGHNGSVLIDGRTYKLNYEDDQDYENRWEPGNTYKVTGSIGSLKTDFNVTVKDDSVKSIKVLNAPVKVQVGTDTARRYTNETEYYEYLAYEKYVELEITMFDDTVVTQNTDGDYLFRGEELPVSFKDDQSKDNSWGNGTHKATAELWNASAEFDVEVDDTPASGVEISDIKIIRNTNISSDGKYEPRPQFTVTLKDGTKLESDELGAVQYNNESFFLNIVDDQDDSAWDIDKHKATGTIFGVSDEFEVEIVESPVKSVSVSTVNLIEESSGSWDYEYDDESGQEISFFRYNCAPVTYTVTLKDDTVLKSDELGYVEYDGNYFTAANITDNQSFKNPWTAGNTYSCKAFILGYEVTYNVKITGSPIKSVSVGDITLIDGYDSSVCEDDGKEWNCFVYDIYSDVKVTLKNGKVIEGENGQIEYNGVYYDITEIEDGQSPDNEWKAGNTYTIKGKLLGCDVSVKVHVISNPIEKVTADCDFIVTENDEEYGFYEDYYEGGNFVGRFFRYEEIVTKNFTVKFKNGKVVTSDEDGYIPYMGRYIRAELEVPKTVQDYYNQWTAGNTYTAVAQLMGFEFSYNVLVLAEDASIPPSATKIILTAPKSSIFVNDKIKLNANVLNPSGNTEFKSSDTKVAAVSSKGLVTAKSAGKVTITAINNTMRASVQIVVSKKANTAKIKILKPSVKYSKLQKKAQTVKAVAVKSPKGKVSFKKVKGDKKISVNKKTGRITFKKGMKKKTYKLKIKVAAAGSTAYKPFKKTVTLKIKVN
ncbi:MAG: Ig-like domain-containing protein [Ruminococcus sp.]|nr:Ig-like domain-containing protein [Ruminococcus sp.]